MVVLASLNLGNVVMNNGRDGVMVGACCAATCDHTSDGYIYKGTITLTRVVSGQKETFYHFNKRGVDYVAKSRRGPYYKLERRMTIGHIDYKY